MCLLEHVSQVRQREHEEMEREKEKEAWHLRSTPSPEPRDGKGGQRTPSWDAASMELRPHRCCHPCAWDDAMQLRPHHPWSFDPWLTAQQGAPQSGDSFHSDAPYSSTPASCFAPVLLPLRQDGARESRLHVVCAGGFFFHSGNLVSAAMYLIEDASFVHTSRMRNFVLVSSQGMLLI